VTVFQFIIENSELIIILNRYYQYLNNRYGTTTFSSSTNKHKQIHPNIALPDRVRGNNLLPQSRTFRGLITAGEWNYSPLVYEEAKKAVRKRNEIAQREVLAPYQPPTVVEETPLPEEDSESYLDRIKGRKVYNLSLLWDRHGGGKKPLIVNIQNPTLWQYFIVKMYVVLSSASVGLEIESPQYSTRIQNALQNTIATKTVEEIQHRQGKIRLKEEIRNETVA